MWLSSFLRLIVLRAPLCLFALLHSPSSSTVLLWSAFFPLCPPLPGFHTLIVKLFRGVAMLLGIGCMAMVAGNMEVLTRNIRYSWSLVFYVMAGIFFFLLALAQHSSFPVRPHPAYPESDLFGLHKGEYEEALNGILSGSSNRVSLLLMASFALAASFPLLLASRSSSLICPITVVLACHRRSLRSS